MSLLAQDVPSILKTLNTYSSVTHTHTDIHTSPHFMTCGPAPWIWVDMSSFLVAAGAPEKGIIGQGRGSIVKVERKTSVLEGAE